MRELIGEKIDVVMVYNRQLGRVAPVRVRWHGRTFKISKIGLHHTVRQGTTLFHIFSVSDGTNFFRLKLDTTSLHWTLEETCDGLAD